MESMVNDFSLFQKIADEIESKDLFCEKDDLLVSFSAGPDSVFLLEFLKMFSRANISLVYFDHGLRPRAVLDKEIAFCKSLRDQGFKVVIKKIPVNLLGKKHALSVEAAGRKLRRKLLVHYAKLFGAKYVLTGHHKDDVCETFIAKIIRGTKANLKGILAKTALETDVFLVRPLLGREKSEIVSYLDSQNIKYCIDETNKDQKFVRNKIRHSVLPVFEEINDSYRANISALCDYLEEQHTFLDNLLIDKLALIKLECAKVSFPLNEFYDLDEFLQRRLVLKITEAVNRADVNNYKGFDIQAKLILQMHKKILEHKNTGSDKYNIVSIPNGYTLNIINGFLVIKQQVKFDKDSYIYNLEGIPGQVLIEQINSIIKFKLIDTNVKNYSSSATHAYVDFDKLDLSNIYIRNRRDGDRFVAFGNSFEKKLKNYFIDSKVPRPERDSVPLFFTQNSLVWVIGHQVSNDYRVTSKTKRILMIQKEKMNAG
jgi:tRNA(Ile)-lysidine synthase